jgi:hypothetical protein
MIQTDSGAGAGASVAVAVDADAHAAQRAEPEAGEAGSLDEEYHGAAEGPAEAANSVEAEAADKAMTARHDTGAVEPTVPASASASVRLPPCSEGSCVLRS